MWSVEPLFHLWRPSFTQVVDHESRQLYGKLTEQVMCDNLSPIPCEFVYSTNIALNSALTINAAATKSARLASRYRSGFARGRAPRSQNGVPGFCEISSLVGQDGVVTIATTNDDDDDDGSQQLGGLRSRSCRATARSRTALYISSPDDSSSPSSPRRCLPLGPRKRCLLALPPSL